MSQLIYIKHHQLDFEKWDKAILSSQFPSVFAQSFYLNATSPNWDALIIGDYKSVFPLTIKSKFGFTYLPQPPFTSQLGVYGNYTNDDVELYLQFILKKFKLINLEFNFLNPIKSNYSSPKNTYIINYNDGFELNQNTKRNIAKAHQHNLVVKPVEYCEVLQLNNHYINPFLKNELHLQASTIVTMTNLLKNAMAEQTLYSFKTIDEFGNIKALGHFICNGKHVLYLKGTNFDKAENSGSMHLLINDAVHFFANKAILFDFGGGTKQGLANFYMGLGGKVLTYHFLKINKLPNIINFLKRKI